jgi:tetratricopeptide (TPR) repeat protein
MKVHLRTATTRPKTMPGQFDQNQPVQNESFAERIDLLFEELSFAFERQRPSILLAFYEFEPVRERAEWALAKRLAENGQPLVLFTADAGHFDIPLLLSQRPEKDRSVFSVSRLSRGGGKENANAYRALNIRREYFVDYAIRVVIWLDRNEAMALSRHAPDFWAFRHRVVEFNDTPEPELPEMSAGAWCEPAQGFPLLSKNLDEQISLHQARLGNLPEQADSRKRRMELLFTLAGLFYAKKAYDQSIPCLQQGRRIARQLNDTIWLAAFWAKLGLVYLELEQPLRAVRACRKAVRLNPQEPGLWSNLGHFYHSEERFSDAIIAYEHVIQLDPQSPLANSALETCYRQMGKNDLAEKKKKLIHHPRNAGAGKRLDTEF